MPKKKAIRKKTKIKKKTTIKKKVIKTNDKNEKISKDIKQSKEEINEIQNSDSKVEEKTGWWS